MQSPVDRGLIGVKERNLEKTFKYAKVLQVKYTKFNVHCAFNRLNKTKNVAD